MKNLFITVKRITTTNYNTKTCKNSNVRNKNTTTQSTLKPKILQLRRKTNSAKELHQKTKTEQQKRTNTALR